MDELVAKRGREYQETEVQIREMEELRSVRQKPTAAAQREREELFPLGVYGSDDESNIIESTTIVDQKYSTLTPPSKASWGGQRASLVQQNGP